jgi:hypothetical protein
MLHTRERCEAMKNTKRNNEKPEVRQLEPQQEQQPQTLTLEQVDIGLKRVEKMLFNQGA